MFQILSTGEEGVVIAMGLHPPRPIDDVLKRRP
jgi:hypothetical protein